MRLPREHRVIGSQFWRTLVDGLAFDREFLERTPSDARVAATGWRLLGDQPWSHREPKGSDHHDSSH
jgi:hypothetical protein